MDIGLVTGAIASVKFGKDVLQAMAEGKVQIESQDRILAALGKLGDVQAALFDLREELFQLQTENQRLARELEESTSWKQRLAEYELVHTLVGGTVYQSKFEPRHYICPSCLNKKELHILQNAGEYTGQHRCPGCKTAYNTFQAKSVNVQSRRGSGGGWMSS